MVVDSLEFKDLQSQLEQLQLELKNKNDEKRKLRYILGGEKLKVLQLNHFKAPIRDPYTRSLVNKDAEQAEIFMQQLPAWSQKRFIHQLLGNYRLAGPTTFDYKSNYLCIRLDTFYNRRYYEPYYIVLDPIDDNRIQWTSLPWFLASIPEIEKRPLSTADLNELLRSYQVALLAFVARREQLKELKDKTDGRYVNISPIGETGQGLTFTRRLPENDSSFTVVILYENTGSMYPTSVKARSRRRRSLWMSDTVAVPQESEPIQRIVDAFKNNTLYEAFKKMV
ncbi:hypothetical protein BC941DRAFT_409357 [Chlamydoabsidia padenii]|nr:hypothetical protein BC941DRAFT_409357 [Chlamydoabsidia padenii]